MPNVSKRFQLLLILKAFRNVSKEFEKLLKETIRNRFKHHGFQINAFNRIYAYESVYLKLKYQTERFYAYTNVEKALFLN